MHTSTEGSRGLWEARPKNQCHCHFATPPQLSTAERQMRMRKTGPGVALGEIVEEDHIEQIVMSGRRGSAMVSLLSIDTSSSSLSAGSASRGLDLRLCDRATGKRSRCSREIEVSVLLRPDCANAMACGKLRKTFLVCPGAAQRRSILPANRPVRRTRSRYFHPAGRSPPVSLRASSQTPLTAASSSLSSSSVSDLATLANAAPAREPFECEVEVLRRNVDPCHPTV